jgi:hypothetical protein
MTMGFAVLARSGIARGALGTERDQPELMALRAGCVSG